MDTPIDRRTKHWYNEREAEYEISQRPTLSEWWCTKHPGACPECGRPYSVHEKLGRCPAREENPYHDKAYSQGWNAGHNERDEANPYPPNTSKWALYVEGYREGAAELKRCVSGETASWVQAIIEKLDRQEADQPC